MMNKIKYDLSFLLLSLLITGSSMFLLHDLYELHVFNDVALSEVVYSFEDDHFALNHFCVYASQELTEISLGTLTIKEESIYDEIDTLQLQFNLLYDTEVVEVIEVDVTLNQGKTVYFLEDVFFEEPLFFDEISIADLDTLLNPSTLISNDFYAVSSNAKDYFLSGCYVSKDYMNLGTIVFKDELTMYDTISVEYRYQDGDDYRVFDKVSCSIDAYIENDYIPFYNHLANNDLHLEQLSVVVILSGEDKESSVFAIDLTVEGVEYDEK